MKFNIVVLIKGKVEKKEVNGTKLKINELEPCNFVIHPCTSDNTKYTISEYTTGRRIIDIENKKEAKTKLLEFLSMYKKTKESIIKKCKEHDLIN